MRGEHRRLLISLMLWILVPGCAVRRVIPPDGTRVVKLMAYNVLFRGSSRQATLDVVAAADADIVCLTELTPAFVSEFNARLGMRYPHRVFRPRTGTWGVGVASKFPVRTSQLFEQRPHRIPALDATLEIDGRAVHLACVHFMSPFAKHRKSDSHARTYRKNRTLRFEQARAMRKRFEKRSPVLIVGDMNENVYGKGVQHLLGAGFQSACWEAPGSDCGASWPGDVTKIPAFVQIDHVLGRGVRFTSARVLPAGGSDHYPVVAEFYVSQ